MSVSDIETIYTSCLDDFSKLCARLLFDFGDDHLLVDGTVSPATISHVNGPADCTIHVSASDLEKIVRGELAVRHAYGSGKLKLSGAGAVAIKFWAIRGKVNDALASEISSLKERPSIPLARQRTA
jgi:ubiquinone biosynthesis protein UbiJ